MYVDFALGRWLYRNPCRRVLTGLAAVAEVHYTTTLQDAQQLDYFDGVSLTNLDFENPANQVDMVNLTVGIHGQIGPCTTCRVGGVFPLTSDDNRSFDSEIQVQVNRYF
jgi:hypothetical protein